MKPASLAAAVLGAIVAVPAFAATDYGTVVSSTPVYGQVPVADRACYDEMVTTQPRPSGAGALAGAVLGGVVGNQFGSGGGRAAATGVGVLLGSVVGNQAEMNGQQPSTSTVTRCQNTTRYEDRVVGFDVVYEYGGMRRSVRMAQDPGGPGARIAVDVNVAGANSAPRGARVGTPVPRAYDDAPPPQAYYDAPPPPRVVYATPAPYYVPAPVYVAPAPVYYGPPAVSFSIGGRWGGYRHGW